MKIVHDPAELRGLPGAVALVPTMGALHEGHLELVRVARRSAQRVVVSVFVNPLQFGPNEDFARYPRSLEQDAEASATAGADIVYAPSVETMYPRGVMSTVHVPEVTERYEGAFRPGHFDGVATVVLKLFNQVRPHHALFGRKDLQQCATILRMVEDLDVPVELEFVPTHREADGLAMSSRNVYLSPEERAVAPRLHTALVQVARAVAGGATAQTAILKAVASLDGFQIDYLDLISSTTFQPLEEAQPDAAVVVAARLGKTRLIDNVELSSLV